MIMSWIWVGILGVSVFFAALTGRGAAVSAAVLNGAQAGVSLAFSMAGSICLWSGVAQIMNGAGLTRMLSNVLAPLTHRIFPLTQSNTALAQDLSANICANFLGLGNAATPLGIRAVKGMTDPKDPARATDEMCRLIVLNTASIQLIPSNVAALRTSLGCGSPFDILPAVWITSLCSAGLGLAAAFVLGKVWCRD